jgi:hypothetical protein
MKKVIINCATGEETLVDYTAEEVAQQEADAITSEEYQTNTENARTQKANLKASAKAKLIAGEALTEDEANTIVL